MRDTEGVVIVSIGSTTPTQHRPWWAPLERSASRVRHPAVTDAHGSVSYAELLEVARRVAGGLRRDGVAAGDVVATVMHPSAASTATLLGIMAAGAVAAPVNARLRPPEVQRYTTTIDAALVLADADHADLAAAARARLAVVEPARDGGLAGRLGALGAAAPTQVPVAGDAPAMIFPTGGTTGTPKGAVIDHAALAQWPAAVARNSGRGPGDVELCVSPFFHVSLLATVFPTLVAGGHAVIQPRFDADEAIRACTEHRVDRLLAAPTLLEMLRDHPGFAAAANAIRWLHFGSMPSSATFVARLLKDFPHAAVSTGYGATEYGPVTRVEDHDLRSGRITGIGRAVPDAEVRVVDETGAEAPAGTVGELAVRVPWQSRGYAGDDPATRAETQRAFGADGFVRLGDLGAAAPDGWLSIVGRSKEMILTGGENVFPTEVEAVLGADPAIRAVAVFGVPDERWGERVEAAVVLAPGGDPATAAEDAVAAARTSLASYKIPRRVHVVAELPLTANNKVDRRHLRARFTDGG